MDKPISSTQGVDSQNTARQLPDDASIRMFRFSRAIIRCDYAGAADELLALMLEAEQRTGVWDKPTFYSIKQLSEQRYIGRLDDMIREQSLSATDLSKVFIGMLMLEKDPSIIIADTLYSLLKYQRTKVGMVLEKLDEHDGDLAMAIGIRMMELDEVENRLLISQDKPAGK